MKDRCESSGLRVLPNEDGRATCPLCEDDWHCLTARGTLREHRRYRNRHLTSDQVLARLVKADDENTR